MHVKFFKTSQQNKSSQQFINNKINHQVAMSSHYIYHHQYIVSKILNNHNKQTPTIDT